MRTRVRSRQKIWVTEITESLDGIDTIQGYSTPVLRREVVTETGNEPLNLPAGIDEVYDRYIITYGKAFTYREGMQIYVDVQPVLDFNGGITADSPRPDYIVKRIISSQKGLATRVGLIRLGANNAT